MEENFMSQKEMDVASVTIYLRGIPHRPDPGAVEGSLGKIHTFRPLRMATGARTWEDSGYLRSWLPPRT